MPALRCTAIVLLAVFASVSAVAGKQFLRTPEVSWADLKPYVEANLRVEHRDGSIVVGVSAATRERDLFEPYDHVLGELATVLLGHVLSDRKLSRIVGRIAEETFEQIDNIDTMSRVELIGLYWGRLEADGRFTSRLQQLFEEAQRSGRLRCLICNKGFKPRYLEPI